jgi:2-keto-4-pentenoate hydratase/2-oxohepta-3-ene-1,7-dioic acid hydratase in catechol pathway
MRLAHYTHAGGGMAVLDYDGTAVDATIALEDTGRARAAEEWASPVRRLLGLGSSALRELDQAGRQIASAGGRGVVNLDGMRLGPPIPDPQKFICVGLNYRDHAAEAGAEIPESPVLFAKFANSLIGAADPIVLPRISEQIDYEGELGVVIGSRAKDLTVEEALSAVAGYTVINDVSARDLQLRTSQWLPGKALDSFAPCGPCLVTADDLPDPQALAIETRLNGEVVQSASCGEMLFTVAEIVAFTSSILTLEPGDLIATGTPAGVGFMRQPPLFLRDGDTVEVQIAGVGALRNPVAGGRGAPSGFHLQGGRTP